MMDQLMQVLAQDLTRLVANHFASGAIDKRAVSLQINAVNALSCRLQNQLHLLREAIPGLFGANTIGDVFMQGDEVLRGAGGIADQGKASARRDDLAVAADEVLGIFIAVVKPLHKRCVPSCPRKAVVGMNDLVPLFGAPKLFLAVAKDLGLRTVQKMTPGFDVKNADTDLGVFVNRTEKLLAGLQGVFGASAFRNVFGEGHDALWFSGSVTKQAEPAVAEEHMAVAADEVLLILVFVTPALDEVRITLRTGVALRSRNDGVPLVDAVEFLLGVAQHVVKSAVREMLVGVDFEHPDAHLGSFENGTEDLFACP